MKAYLNYVFPNKYWRRLKIISTETIETKKNKTDIFLEVKVNESLQKIF